jgi:hypothetical protein
MAPSALPSYILQCLEKQQGVSAYRDSRGFSIRLTFTYMSVAPEQYTSTEAHAKLVMAKGALDRLADPDFPHELRLQIMKEGVVECTSWWYIAHDTTIDDLRKAVYEFVFSPSGITAEPNMPPSKMRPNRLSWRR